LIEWTKQAWDDLLALDVMDQILLPFNERKISFKLIEPVNKMINDYFDGIGLIMTDEEKQAGLIKILKDESVKRATESLMLEFVREPEVKVEVLDVDELIQNYPQWFETISEVDEIFSDITDSYTGKKD
jgi:hypothetical protein